VCCVPRGGHECTASIVSLSVPLCQLTLSCLQFSFGYSRPVDHACASALCCQICGTTVGLMLLSTNKAVADLECWGVNFSGFFVEPVWQIQK